MTRLLFLRWEEERGKVKCGFRCYFARSTMHAVFQLLERTKWSCIAKGHARMNQSDRMVEHEGRPILFNELLSYVMVFSAR